MELDPVIHVRPDCSSSSASVNFAPRDTLTFAPAGSAGLTAGNLITHLRKLEAGYVRTPGKGGRGASVALTDRQDEAAFARYIAPGCGVARLTRWAPGIPCSAARDDVRPATTEPWVDTGRPRSPSSWCRIDS